VDASGGWACFGASAVYLLVCAGCVLLLRESYGQHNRLLRANVDSIFRESYARFFVHGDGEDQRYRWKEMSSKVLNKLRTQAG